MDRRRLKEGAQFLIIVGLTGATATGKSTIAGLLARKGAVVIDADRLGHKAIVRGGPSYAAVVARFGRGVLAENQEIDRPLLAGLVFSDRGALADLESLTHPAILAMINERLAEVVDEADIVVLEAAVLHRAGWAYLCDVVVVVDSPPDLRLARLRARGLTDSEARQRIDARQPEPQTEGPYQLDNSLTLAHLSDEVDVLWHDLLDRLEDKRKSGAS